MKIYSYAIKVTFFCAVFYGQLIGTHKSDSEWTWQYCKRITTLSDKQKKNKDEVIFSQDGVPPFSQLIFSWNAFRPPVGSFSFFVSVKDNNTKKWGSWHKMVQWGAGVQQSFHAKHDDGSRYVYVRFEVDSGMASGFRVKVVANNSADMALLKELHVNISDFSKFTKEPPTNFHTLNTVLIKNVPCFSQLELEHPRNTGLCSPTACGMVVSYLTKKHIDVIDFAEKSFDNGLDTYGSWPFNVAHAFEKTDGTVSFAASRLSSFKDIHGLLSRGIPVLVSVRGDLHGAPKKYENGHFIVVVGWDSHNKAVICQDPAFQASKEMTARYPVASFLDAWERSRRLSYIAKPISF